FAERRTENKRKQDDNQQQQQQNKRQNTGRVYTAGTGEKKPYRDLNLYALNATITTMVYVLLNATSATELAIWPASVRVLQILMLVTIRGALGQNRNHENQVEGTEARGMVYTLRGGETDQDPNIIEDEICSILDIITQAWMIWLANYLERESEVSSERKCNSMKM
ncbi:hypothetical protein Tco_1299254, partial [Tanacetum coccineum]